MSRFRLAVAASWALVLSITACVAEYQAIPEGAAESSGDGAPATSAGETEVDESAGELDCGEWVECFDECVDLDQDVLHCGECDLPCETGHDCIEGVCLLPCGLGCDPLLSYCDGDHCRCRPETINCNGECVDPRNDPEHCGDCHDPCPESEPLCGDGECQPDCDEFVDVCEDSCTDLAFDPFNCGFCGHRCAVGDTCVEGECIGYAQLDPVQCVECPCPLLCTESCCFSEYVDGNICLEAPDCPEE